MEHTKKSIIIVGAGPGIGRGVAEKFGTEGYNVGLISRNAKSLETLKEQLENEGIVTVYATADVTNIEAFSKALRGLNEKLPNVTVVHYNVAPMAPKHLLSYDTESFIKDLHIGLGGIITVINTLFGKLKVNKGGLLLTGGGFADYPSADFATTSIAKAGIRNLAPQLFEALKEEGMYAGALEIFGEVSETAERHNPKAIGEQFFQLWQNRSEALVKY
ncbi:SDR family NAD(P)-dependent oxidoreductase [Aquimarina sp. U1-2]|uniref:SDR family NAD(P)-dependent oxidoreductase n=1 Tax=Aquimarina sp. U1-2 TaxID=2823141 RepID=UPI001AECF0C8|nr:SDR family NAD(P)-dependent oxidoreductase [Aquimarina sp. U1-2]MBP2833773.1 SDR family NAD(P)-dependent oxidoreductase [Aquimarina sp. U1-2]